MKHPQAIGPYRLTGLLGQGGMGAVYRGLAPDGQAVAIKLSLGAEPELLLRFQRECRLQQQLGGQGLVPLLDVGVAEGHPYAVLPLLEGGDLHQRLREGPLRWEEALELVERLARAVGRMHRAGVVHRDLKPQNVLFDAAGAAWVADLGLSKHSDRGVAQDSISLSQTGAMSGSKGYMAPEQAMDSKRAGPPADVFSLAAILYTAIAGREPFAASGLLGYLKQSALGKVEPLRATVPEVPEWLDACVLQALGSEPEERPADADAFAELLARPRTRPRRAPLLLLGGGLLVLALGVGAAHLARGERGEPSRTQAALDAGEAAAEAGDYDGAVAAYTRALEARPDWVPALLGRARALAWLGSRGTEPMLADVERALELGPEDPETLIVAASALATAGREPQRALALLARAERQDEALAARTCHTRAKLQLQLGDALGARATIERWLPDAPPERAYALQLLLGDVCRALADAAPPAERAALDEQVRAAYQAAWSLRSSRTGLAAAYELGRFEASRGEHAAAIAAYERALDGDASTGDYVVVAYRGASLQALGRLDEALADYALYCEHHPENAERAITLASLALNHGQGELAQVTCERSLSWLAEHGSDDSVSQWVAYGRLEGLLGRACEALGRPSAPERRERALDRLRAALDRPEGGASEDLHRIFCDTALRAAADAMRREDYGSAVQRFVEVVEDARGRDPSLEVQARLGAVRALLLQGDLERATSMLGEADEARLVGYELGELRVLQAEVALGHGDLAAAERGLQDARALAPRHPRLRALAASLEGARLAQDPTAPLRFVRTAPGNHEQPVLQLAPNPSGSLVAAVSREELRCWRVARGGLVGAFALPPEDPCLDLAWVDDEELLVLFASGALLKWQPQRDRVQSSPPPGAGPRSLACGPQRTFAVAGPLGLKLYDRPPWEGGRESSQSPGDFVRVRFGPRGGGLALATSARSVRWGAAGRVDAWEVGGFPLGSELAFSPDGARVAIHRRDALELRAWPGLELLATRDLAGPAPGVGERVGVCFDASGIVYTAGSAAGVQAWRADDLVAQPGFELGWRAADVARAGDGVLLAAGENRAVEVLAGGAPWASAYRPTAHDGRWAELSWLDDERLVLPTPDGYRVLEASSGTATPPRPLPGVVRTVARAGHVAQLAPAGITVDRVQADRGGALSMASVGPVEPSAGARWVDLALADGALLALELGAEGGFALQAWDPDDPTRAERLRPLGSRGRSASPRRRSPRRAGSWASRALVPSSWAPSCAWGRGRPGTSRRRTPCRSPRGD
ncbi:MAG: protein kinase [Planctomycetota bacterium]